MYVGVVHHEGWVAGLFLLHQHRFIEYSTLITGKNFPVFSYDSLYPYAQKRVAWDTQDVCTLVRL